MPRTKIIGRHHGVAKYVAKEDLPANNVLNTRRSQMRRAAAADEIMMDDSNDDSAFEGPGHYAVKAKKTLGGLGIRTKGKERAVDVDQRETPTDSTASNKNAKAGDSPPKETTFATKQEMFHSMEKNFPGLRKSLRQMEDDAEEMNPEYEWMFEIMEAEEAAQGGEKGDEEQTHPS